MNKHPLQRFLLVVMLVISGVGAREDLKADQSSVDARIESLIFSTFLGGEEFDTVHGIAVDPLGYIYLVGKTHSRNFPVANAHQSECALGPLGSCADAFLTKLTPDGAGLVYSTYLGERFTDEAWDVAVDDTGNAYVTGTIGSGGFVAKFNPAGQMLYLRKIEAYPFVASRAIAVDQLGNAYTTGHTLSAQFPTRNALQGNPGGVSCHAIGGGSFPLDAFVAGFDALGTLEFSTYLGGNGNDIGLDIAVDALGNLYIVGETSSANFPLAGPLRENYQGGSAQPVGTCSGDDGFVTKLNADRTVLAYSTYFFKNRFLSVDRLGQAILGDKILNPQGTAYSIPVPGSALAANPDGRIYSLCRSGVLASNLESEAELLRLVDEAGNLFLGGAALPGSIPLLNPLQPNHRGVMDGFVAKVEGCATEITATPSAGQSLQRRREQLNRIRHLSSTPDQP
jgi:Beta-propeller repeat